MKDELRLWLGIWGRRIGVTLVLGPLGWDILWMGVRNMERVKICWPWGVISMLLGVAIWKIGDQCDKSF